MVEDYDDGEDHRFFDDGSEGGGSGGGGGGSTTTTAPSSFADDACDAYGVQVDGSGVICLSGWQKGQLYNRVMSGASLTLAERGYVLTGKLGAEAAARVAAQTSGMLPRVTTTAISPWLLLAAGLVAYYLWTSD